MKVTELTAMTLPQAFLDCLPKTCPFCGAYTEITEGLTALTCSNPMCKSKLAERMKAMLDDIGVKNLGTSKCQAFIEAYNIKSPYALFEFCNTDGTAKNVLYAGCSKEFSDEIARQLADKRNKQLWEFVRIGNLPGIRDSAKKLFGGYSDINIFYKDLADTQRGGILFIQRLLGIDSTITGYYDKQTGDCALSVKAVDIYNTLCAAKGELCHYQQFFNIITVLADSSVDICISSAVGAPYKTKADFTNQMVQLYGDSICINRLSSLTKQCDALVWSKVGAPTSKVEKARKQGTPIVTGNGFDVAMRLVLGGADIKWAIEQVALTEGEANPTLTPEQLFDAVKAKLR